MKGIVINVEQLTLQDLQDLIKKVSKSGIDLKDIKIYLGNDDELNGIHNGWFLTPISKLSKNEDNLYILDMINEDSHCSKMQDDLAILIS